MVSQRSIEVLVGLFLLITLIALALLAFKVSGLTTLFPTKNYQIAAAFDDIGGLKVHAAVKIGGVQIGEVSQIELDPKTFRAFVKMRINKKFQDIPDDSSAGILTAGLLGDNYVAITPMYNKTYLKDGSLIQMTNSALVLEKLIGQFIYKLGNKPENATTQQTPVSG
mgnify:CR=1 FL=1